MRSIIEKAEQVLTRRRAELAQLRQRNELSEREVLEASTSDGRDRAAARQSSEITQRLSERERLELNDIDAALERLKAGTFGTCARCGSAIGRQRLAALPQTTYCVSCEGLVELGR